MKDSSNATQAASDVSPYIEVPNAYELLVAELESRRERLEHLLRMVTLEANRHAVTPVAVRRRPKCKRAARIS
jgi:hypothetical protein